MAVGQWAVSHEFVLHGCRLARIDRGAGLGQLAAGSGASHLALRQAGIHEEGASDYKPVRSRGGVVVRLLASHQGGSPTDSHMWESCRVIPLVGGFSRGSPAPSARFIPVLLHTHLASPSSALKTLINTAKTEAELSFRFLSWDIQNAHVDLEKELEALTAQAPEGEEARNGERPRLIGLAKADSACCAALDESIVVMSRAPRVPRHICCWLLREPRGKCRRGLGLRRCNLTTAIARSAAAIYNHCRSSERGVWSGPCEGPYTTQTVAAFVSLCGLRKFPSPDRKEHIAQRSGRPARPGATQTARQSDQQSRGSLTLSFPACGGGGGEVGGKHLTECPTRLVPPLLGVGLRAGDILARGRLAGLLSRRLFVPYPSLPLRVARTTDDAGQLVTSPGALYATGTSEILLERVPLRRGQHRPLLSRQPIPGEQRDTLLRGHGDVVVRLLTSHKGKPGSSPGAVAPGFSHMGVVPDDASGRRVFSRVSPPPPALYSGAAPYSPHPPSSAFNTSIVGWTPVGTPRPRSISEGAIRATLNSLLASHRSYAQGVQCFRRNAVLPPECKGGGNGRPPEKTRRPSSGTIPACENPGVTMSGNEPGSP
ncbi:hypothetical protein PR048_016424 [Dryococelus australis]|uniref:Uncharacterized protein n=1 Tax=Dryococelus australis TaxID=614101 RepID=A0ABQ9HJQ5_9NEOP|nr:hypothetical protein PR048_016424 [Dryococelus australis]